MKYYALVGVFFIVAYLLPLAGRPMVTPDEFRYAEIPREMIDRGDYVTPHLVNMRYFEKPVMGYWMTARMLLRCVSRLRSGPGSPRCSPRC